MESGNDVTGSIRYAKSGFNIQMKVCQQHPFFKNYWTIFLGHVFSRFSLTQNGRLHAPTSCSNRCLVKVNSARSFVRTPITCKVNRACAQWLSKLWKVRLKIRYRLSEDCRVKFYFCFVFHNNKTCRQRHRKRTDWLDFRVQPASWRGTQKRHSSSWSLHDTRLKRVPPTYTHTHS